jgi:hypothetical protein
MESSEAFDFGERRDSAEIGSELGADHRNRCFCDEGELCHVCLGNYAGLLVAVAGDDGEDLRVRESQQEHTHCRCDDGEVCRYCLGPEMRDKIIVKLSRPWHSAPESVRNRVMPLDWLDYTGQRN